MQPVILLGTERSGTNLLRRYLDAHDEIASPPPAGLIAPMASCSHLYLDGRYGDDGMAQWVRAALALIGAHPADWDMEISPDDILPRIHGPSHWDLFRAFNELYAERHRASTWFSKEPEAVHHVADLVEHLERVKFVYLVRDGRDVAASMLRGGVHDRHIYGAARRWYRDQAAGVQWLEDASVRERIHPVRYEDFIADPEAEMLKLLAFLGHTMDAAIFESHTNERIAKHTRNSALWENLSQPVKADNFGKYRQALSESEIALFESITREQLTYFGYTPDTPPGSPPAVPSRLRIKLAMIEKAVKDHADPSIRREIRIRREFRTVVRKLMDGQPFP